jgi:glyoxylate carboligase
VTGTVAATETGAARIVNMLEQLGVRLAFGLPGAHNLPAWKALSASSVRLVGVRHEQSAVYAADGDARGTGDLGVALVTTGPGAVAVGTDFDGMIAVRAALKPPHDISPVVSANLAVRPGFRDIPAAPKAMENR